jgi:hypothetical protein
MPRFRVIAIIMCWAIFGITGVRSRSCARTISKAECPACRRNCTFPRTSWTLRAIGGGILECFEMATMPGVSDDEKRRLLSSVVVGSMRAVRCRVIVDDADVIWTDRPSYIGQCSNGRLVKVFIRLIPSSDLSLPLTPTRSLCTIGTGPWQSV